MKWIRPQDELPELQNTNEKYSGIYSDVVLICRNGNYYVAYLHSLMVQKMDSGLLMMPIKNLKQRTLHAGRRLYRHQKNVWEMMFRENNLAMARRKVAHSGLDYQPVPSA